MRLMDSGKSICEKTAFVQIKCSATPICIETGRYSHGHYIPVIEPVREFCKAGIEDEIYVIRKCNLHHDLHHVLFYYAELYNPFIVHSVKVKSLFIVNLMFSSDIMKYTAKYN
jgi:hypothetical protein